MARSRDSRGRFTSGGGGGGGDASLLVTFIWNENFKTEWHEAINRAVRITFEGPIKSDARANSPVDTGKNRDSLDTEVTQLPAGSTQATLYGQSGYSGYLETGTVRMPARPYIVPAFFAHQEDLIANMIAQVAAI